MRIIAGLYRGRKLKTLRGIELRPTPDRLRETLFDVLGDSVRGSIFIDAYAGTGAVGIEALSRGARQVYLIEENSAAIRVMESNIALLCAAPDSPPGFRDSVSVIRAPAPQGLRALEARGVSARFCFLDPPYKAHGEYARSLRMLGASRLIEAGGWIVVQHSKLKELDERAGCLARFRLLIQGSNALSFYHQAGNVRPT
jgi:16S rRNA (guanine(966)-N(2))-methyltransferase RsmD